MGLAFTSCDTNNEPTGYDPSRYNYTMPQSFSLDLGTVEQNQFNFTYTPTTAGKGYYIVVPAGTPTPTSKQVYSGAIRGVKVYQRGNFDVDGSTPVQITVDSGIYGGYGYDVYGISQSTDRFISEKATKISATTIDNGAPVFLKTQSAPAYRSTNRNPFGAVMFAFDEPVFYQGTEIKFTGHNSGREIVVSGAAVKGSGTTRIVIATHGTFAEDDFIKVTWPADSFKDVSGNGVAELSGIMHYFKTRAFTHKEKVKLMAGNYTYTIDFWGGSLQTIYNNNSGILDPARGEYEIKVDATDPDGNTLLGMNVFSKGGANFAQNLKMKLKPNGSLDVVNTPSAFATSSGLTTYWGPYKAYGLIPRPGGWSFSRGLIKQWNTLFFTHNDRAIDDIDYNYTRIGTYAKGGKDDIGAKPKRTQPLNNSVKLVY